MSPYGLLLRPGYARGRSQLLPLFYAAYLSLDLKPMASDSHLPRRYIRCLYLPCYLLPILHPLRISACARGGVPDDDQYQKRPDDRPTPPHYADSNTTLGMAGCISYGDNDGGFSRPPPCLAHICVLPHPPRLSNVRPPPVLVDLVVHAEAGLPTCIALTIVMARAAVPRHNPYPQGARALGAAYTATLTSSCRHPLTLGRSRPPVKSRSRPESSTRWFFKQSPSQLGAGMRLRVPLLLLSPRRRSYVSRIRIDDASA
ncbi:hypothetical protein R3P38DRAFT_3237329 [Favolaschia claudopus]|uniref:Uncharacterized protein n=1 Tax=Favolaschia claudopus TaxID=2862362 RepID=A0AAV9ZBL7_9AGAR